MVQGARRRGAVVVAVSRNEARRTAAADLGAAGAVTPRELTAAVKHLSRGQGLDVVVELVGRRGRLVLVGYTADQLTVSPRGLVVAQQRVLASVGATSAELVYAVALGVASRLRLPIAATLPLAAGNDALDRLRAGALTNPVQRA